VLYFAKTGLFCADKMLKSGFSRPRQRCTVLVIFCIVKQNTDLCSMFIKPIIRNVRGTLDRYIYYRLCDSYRDENGRSKWRNVPGLDRMEGMNRNQREGFIHRLNEMLKGTPGLFIAADDPVIEVYAREIFHKLLDTGKISMEEIMDGSHHCKLREAEERAKADLVKALSLRHKRSTGDGKRTHLL
jgi:hypothetical protein